MEAKIKELIETAKSKADKAAQDWLKEQMPRIEGTVRSMLDRRVQEVVGKLLGFRAQYGDAWEVDHCNGRSGESAAGDWLRKQAGEAVRQWLTAQAGNLPDLSDKTVASLRAQYRRTLEEEVLRLVQEKALNDARAELARVCAA